MYVSVLHDASHVTFELRTLEREELELALKRDARLDAELDLEEIGDLEELMWLLLLMLLLLLLLLLMLLLMLLLLLLLLLMLLLMLLLLELAELTFEDTEEDFELLELDEDDMELLFLPGARILLSFLKTGLASTTSSSLRLICLISFSAAFGPT